MTTGIPVVHFYPVWIQVGATELPMDAMMSYIIRDRH